MHLHTLILSLALLPVLWNIVAAQEKLGTANDVVIHQISGPETLNLITAFDASAQEIHGLMYETLTMTDPYTLETIPWIASLPTISSDRLTYEFVLNKNAKFSDGRPVTADDFIFYLKMIKNPLILNALPLRGYYSRIDRLEKVNNDPYHLRAVMTEPYYLAADILGGLYAFPKHIWDPSGLSDRITFRELNEDDPDGNPAIAQIADSINDFEKGFTSGRRTDFRFKIVVNSGNRRGEHMAMIFTDALKQLGIDTDVASLEWAAVIDRMLNGNYDAMISGWAMNPTEGDMYQIWHSASAKDGGSNYIRYRNPEVDRLIEQIRGEFDFNKRKDLYRQFQRIINDDQPYTFLVSEQQTAAYSNRLQNVHFFLSRPGYNPAFWKW